ncbi:MAG TPA: chromate efflux transporter [Candidatus Acidoferrum sp.]|nr:chromate efflux transporter [Candidatus Acidoferrum sp.]
MREVFFTFLRLGMTSFGGPIAHLGYYRRTFVEERRWLDEATFARIVAFCSILPGPTSSQVGLLVGLVRGGPLGALVAWLCFTGPSAILMAVIAALLVGAEGRQPPPWFGGLLDGLFAAAAGVVAQAVLALRRALVTDASTALIAVGAGVLAFALRGFPGLQWLPIAAGALAGAVVLHGTVKAEGLPIRVSRPVAIVSGVLVVALLSLTLIPHAASALSLAATLVRAGSLVFGGGHVVLPLLQATVTDGLVAARDFFAGYGAAQAMPGPLFSFASFLGYANHSPLHGPLGALVATVLIFAPSFAMIFALAPIWNRIASAPRAGGALRGANASVVGLLAAVLYDPILVSLGWNWLRLGIGALTLVALLRFKIAPWIVVIAAAILGAIVHA